MLLLWEMWRLESSMLSIFLMSLIQSLWRFTLIFSFQRNHWRHNGTNGKKKYSNILIFFPGVKRKETMSRMRTHSWKLWGFSSKVGATLSTGIRHFQCSSLWYMITEAGSYVDLEKVGKYESVWNMKSIWKCLLDLMETRG